MESLRNELQQYGEMLVLLEQQQASVMARCAEDVMQSVNTINRQIARIQTARQDREACQRELAALVQVAEDPTFANLLPLMPEQYQPALIALVRENNELLVRVQQRARQNHLLLARSVDLMQRFIASLVPETSPLTYQ